MRCSCAHSFPCLSTCCARRTVGINSKTRKSSVALNTAKGIFPQAASLLK